GQPLPLLPVLCGSFHRYLEQQRSPAEDDTLMVAIASLRERLAGRRALIIAAGDLAHSGPAFGDGPQGPQQRTLGRTADEALIGAICRGDVEGFWAQIAAEGDRRHICGAAPIYLALRLLEPVRGEPAGYLQAPADAQGASFVSVAGVALL
ncbi:MAG: MEMO1 family protein, partial [Anaerolineae bacterium]